MAEIEYKGIKIGGSKLLLVLPLVGTIIGGLWGGFELFNRYQMMEQKINSYVAPDLSGFARGIASAGQVNRIADIQEPSVGFNELTNQVFVNGLTFDADVLRCQAVMRQAIHSTILIPLGRI